jgi:hypothetical protein
MSQTVSQTSALGLLAFFVFSRCSLTVSLDSYESSPTPGATTGDATATTGSSTTGSSAARGSTTGGSAEEGSATGDATAENSATGGTEIGDASPHDGRNTIDSDVEDSEVREIEVRDVSIEEGPSPPDSGEDAASEADACGPTYAAVVKADLPAAYWRLGETQSSPHAKDETMNYPAVYRDGVIRGVPGALACDPDTAIQLTGIMGSTVDLGPIFPFVDRSPFSLEVWIKLASIDESVQRILNRRNDDGTDGYRLFVDDDDTIAFERWRDGAADARVETQAAPLVGSFTHVVGTYDGEIMVLYIDGISVSTDTSEADLLDTTTADFIVGAMSTEDGDFFRGDVDEIAIYDYALTAEQVLHHYRASGASASPDR